LSPSAGPGWLVDGPDAAWTLALAHGAGQGMGSPFMQAIAQGLAAAGVRVVRFGFPYMVERSQGARQRPPDREPVLLATWREVIARLVSDGCPRDALVIGGKSLGGRMASLLADQEQVAGLVCLGYPFHPPGRPERLRTAHLETIRTPTLICQGTRDPFGSRAEVAGYRLAPAVRLAWIEEGEHSFKPRRASGRTESQNLAAVLAETLVFLQGLARP